MLLPMSTEALENTRRMFTATKWSSSTTILVRSWNSTFKAIHFLCLTFKWPQKDFVALWQRATQEIWAPDPGSLMREIRGIFRMKIWGHLKMPAPPQAQENHAKASPERSSADELVIWSEKTKQARKRKAIINPMGNSTRVQVRTSIRSHRLLECRSCHKTV